MLLRRVSYFPPSEAETRLKVSDEFHHHLDPERMPFAYRDADVFIGASRVQEGFGLPSLEALSCGVPCLLSNVPGQKEIGGAAAWYFPDGDSAGIADMLPSLFTEEARRKAHRDGPVQASLFSTAKVAQTLELIFKQALAQ